MLSSTTVVTETGTPPVSREIAEDHLAIEQFKGGPDACKAHKSRVIAVSVHRRCQVACLKTANQLDTDSQTN